MEQAADLDAFSVSRIEEMVHRFYGQVREDDLLGPVFESRVTDWTTHLGRMVLFWRSVLRGEGLFRISPRGGPPSLHQAIDELSYAHFERWLTLFSGVVDEVYPADAAAEVKVAARGIAASLSRHLPPAVSSER